MMRDRLKVLYISYFYPPHSAMGANRAYHFSTRLAERGHQVTVIAAEPTSGYTDTSRYHDWLAPARGQVRVIRTAVAEEHVENVKSFVRSRSSHRTLTNTNAAATTAAKRPNLLVGALEGLRHSQLLPETQMMWNPEAFLLGIGEVLRDRPDVIFVSGRPFVSFFAAAAIKWATRIPLVLDLRDPWSLMAKGETGKRVARAQESRLFSMADRIVLNTDNSRRAYQKAYPEPIASRMLTIRNGMTAWPGPNPVPEGPKILLYGGNLYQRNLSPFLTALSRYIERGELTPDDLRLRLIGRLEADNFDPELLARLEPYLELHPFMPYAAFRAHIDAATAMVIPIADLHMCIPGKFFECLSDGKPVLFLGTRRHELFDALEHEIGAGVSAEPDDVEAITAAIDRLFSTTVPKLEAAPLPRAILARHHIDARVDELEALLRHVVRPDTDGLG